VPVDLSDPVSQCVTQRFQSVMGNIQHGHTEPLRLVKHSPNGFFNLHYGDYDDDDDDGWLHVATPLETTTTSSTPGVGSTRVGRLFAYLDDSCAGGEMYFPHVPGVHEGLDMDTENENRKDPDATKFSRSISGRGLVVNPVRGNAVFWINVHMNGTRDKRVTHTDLPAISGT